MYHNVGASCFRRFLQSVMQVGAGFIKFFTLKKKWCHLKNLGKLESLETLIVKL